MNTLKVGDKAPNFETKDNQGIIRKLGDYSGKKLVVFFYPKASTPGCTAEACNLRDHYQTFQSKGYEILGVSADSEKRQQNFVQKHQLPTTTRSKQEVLPCECLRLRKQFQPPLKSEIQRLAFCTAM